jgi:hypothetical protein
MQLDGKVLDDSPIRLVNQIVDNLDISKIVDSYKGSGTTSYYLRMMLKVLLYARLFLSKNSQKYPRKYPLYVAFRYAGTGFPHGQHFPLFTPEGHDQSDIYTSSATACRYGLPDFKHDLY